MLGFYMAVIGGLIHKYLGAFLASDNVGGLFLFFGKKNWF